MKSDNSLWNLKEIWIAVIISLALVLSVTIYCLGTRYQMIKPTGEVNGVAFMYDRITGKYWFCATTEYWRVKTEGKTQ